MGIWLSRAIDIRMETNYEQKKYVGIPLIIITTTYLIILLVKKIIKGTRGKSDEELEELKKDKKDIIFWLILMGFAIVEMIIQLLYYRSIVGH